MCYCTPEIRTPCCGGANCHPKEGEEKPLAIRLAEEKLELHARMCKLQKFVISDKFDELEERERDLLKKQLRAIQNYYSALNQRCYRHSVGKWHDED